MPSPYVKKLASETGKSVAEIEKLWDKAKGITADTFGKSEDDFGTKEYKYTVGIIKNMLGVNEMVLDPSIFLKSGKSAKDFIKETVVSANFSIGDTNPVSPSPDANGGEEDAEQQTYHNFPGADKDDFTLEHIEIPQGSADVGDVLNDLSSNARENSPAVDPENPDDLRSLGDSQEEDDIILPPDEYYEQFESEEDLSYLRK